MDSLKTSTDVSVTIFIGIKKVASLIDWHFEGKRPKFSRSALYIRGSWFKNLAFPCLQGTTLTDLAFLGLTGPTWPCQVIRLISRFQIIGILAKDQNHCNYTKHEKMKFDKIHISLSQMQSV